MRNTSNAITECADELFVSTMFTRWWLFSYMELKWSWANRTAVTMSRILSRIIRGRQRPEPNGNGDTEDASRHDNALALTHLKKIFGEFRHPLPGATIQSQEEKLYSMIPLFNRVSRKFYCKKCWFSALPSISKTVQVMCAYMYYNNALQCNVCIHVLQQCTTFEHLYICIRTWQRD